VKRALFSAQGVPFFVTGGTVKETRNELECGD